MSDTITVEQIADHAETLSDEEIIRRIRSMNMSAKDKGLLRTLMDSTMEVRGKLVHIGKKLLDICLIALEYLLEQYPATMAGLLLGALLGLVFSAIPILGWVLGPLVGPVLTLGIGSVGLLQDLGAMHLIRDRLAGK